MVSSMDGTSILAMLVRVAIVANHAIYNYSEGYTVTAPIKRAANKINIAMFNIIFQ